MTPVEWNRMLDSLPKQRPYQDDWDRGKPTRAEIEWQDLAMLWQQKAFRVAAGYIAGKYQQLGCVAKIALMGSAARPLWKEIPRFSKFKRYGIEIWHECKDADLAVWVDGLDSLSQLRKARISALNSMHEEHPDIMGVPQDRAEVFLFKPVTNRYLGRLCSYKSCPKENKPDCRVKGCGSSPFLRLMAGFRFYPDAIHENRIIPLYERGNPSMLPPPGTSL
jgi:hypothetical protein